MNTNEIDALMDLDPLKLTKENIDDIIAYQRRHRANLAAGKKATKDTGPKITIDLTSLGLKKPSEPVKRRI